MPNGSRATTPTIDLASRPTVAVGDVHLLASTLVLERGGVRVTVERRVMQVLAALADGAGRVVAREQLLDLCWGATVVGEDALHRAVAGARRALRDVGSAVLTVETIPKVGYRLAIGAAPDIAATVAPAPSPADAFAGHTGPPPSAAPRRRLLWAGAAAAAIGALGLAAWRSASRVPSEALALMAQGEQALRLAVPEADRQGAGFFEQALRLAPQHAPAWGLLALARRNIAEYAPPDRLPAAVAAAEQAVNEALKLDARQPHALTARALLKPAFGRWGEAEDELQAVLDRDPEHLPAIDAKAFLLASTGVIALHYPLRLKTVASDPFHAGYNFRSVFSHWMNGQVPRADQAGERGLELWPDHAATWGARFQIFKYTGRTERALAMLDDTAPRLPPPLQSTLRPVCLALGGGGTAERSAARDMLLASVERGGPLAAVGATNDLAALGEIELALQVTEAYLLERGPQRAGTAWRPGQALHNDVRRRLTNQLFVPVTAPLRAHPRFQAIVAEIGLAAYWQRPQRQPDHMRPHPTSR